MFKKRIKYLFSHNKLLILKVFLTIFGGIWLIIEFPSNLSPSYKSIIDSVNLPVLYLSILISAIISFYISFPKNYFKKHYKGSNTSITLKVGNLLEEKCNIVIGSSDYFDTHTDPNAQISLKYQIINKFFNKNIEQVDDLIQKSLYDQKIYGNYDSQKPFGKNHQFPIGTVAILPFENRKIFILVISKIVYNNQSKFTESDPNLLNLALNQFWEKLNSEGRMKEISIPVLGSGLAKVNLSFLLLIQIIILSFIIYSKNKRITENLNIVISDKHYDPNEFADAIEFLNSIVI